MSNPQPVQTESLPRGTVTFLFTDVEGSTRLWEQYPEAAHQALARHDALIEQIVNANAGQLVRPRGEGDSRFAVFPRATDGVAAAREIQLAFAAEPWHTPSPLRVRMALHTGEADLREGDYYGSEVNRCARLRALAYGGQVLLSQATYVLIRDALPPGVGVRNLGEHRLKDLQRPEHVYQLVVPNLPADFPPLHSLNTVPNNLPTQLSSFIGRERELQEVKELLSRTRLLTLTGPGGTGKTRLSLQVAADVVDEFKDGAWFVDLSTLTDPALVIPTIARTLGVRDTGERPALELLQNYLCDKELLLILDNFEQVIDAAPLVKDLLVNAPRVQALVTSRTVLRVTGEQEYGVPQFSLPDLRHLPPLEQLSQYEAVRLFIERARAYKAGWTITNENAPAVAEICYRLDGLPLAIELAAARVRLLPPAKILAQLSNRLEFLKSPARDLPARQQTLRGAIDWSYNLLSEEEQTLFRQFAVFAGGATLEAVQAVCGVEGTVDVLTGLESLVDKSLIRQSEAGGEARFAMLETIREYATSQLNEDPQLRQRTLCTHALYFADLTQSQWAHLTGEERETALALLESEIENIRAAWQYWVTEGNLEQLGKFADSLLLLNDARGWYQATVELTLDLLKVLSSTAATPEHVREEITLQASLARALMITRGYYAPEAEQAYARALALAEHEGDTPDLFLILRALSRFYIFRAEFDKAIRIAERIQSLSERLGDTTMQVDANLVIGTGLSSVNPRASLEYLEKAVAALRFEGRRTHRLSLGTNPGVSSLTTTALILWMLGFSERARQRASEALARAQDLDHPFTKAYALFHNGLLHLWLREIKVAEQRAQALLDIAGEYEYRVWSAVGSCLRGAAMAERGAAQEGVALLQRGLDTYQALKTPPAFFPFLLLLSARAYGLAKRPQEGVDLLNQALDIVQEPRPSVYASQLGVLKGQLLVQISADNAAEAESYFQRALDAAVQMQALMFELKAAVSLTRLWQEQGQLERGRELLSHTYTKFTEGFTTPDLQEAKALLDALA